MPLVTTKDESPAISVIVPSYNSLATLPLCLDALYAQSCEESFEILLIDSSNDGTAELVRERYPDVRLIQYAKKTLPGRGRNRGAREARGMILAFTDADCIPPPQWLRQHVAHHGNWDVVGGSLRNGNPRSLVGWVCYLLEFNSFTPGRKVGLARNLVSANVSYKRDVFDAAGFPEDMFPGEDFVFHWRLSATRSCYLDRSLAVDHLNRTSIRDFLVHQQRLGVASVTTRQRINVRGKIFLKYPLLIFLTPFLRPPVLWLRLFRNTPSLVPIAVLLFPFLFVGITWWAVSFYRQAQCRSRNGNKVKTESEFTSPSD